MSKFVAGSALVLATAFGTAAAFPAPALASGTQIWATVGYVLQGQWVGGATLYCDGEPDVWGNTTNYDTAHWTYYGMCP